MAKTTFSSGVIVTSQFLNGAQQLYFDGQDLDWHYAPLGLNSLVRTGPNGLDAAYVSLDSDQPSLDPSGLYSSGTPITGTKVVRGVWNFGFDPLQVGNPPNIIANAPKSYTTNDKFNNANSIPNPTIAQKFAALDSSDLVTKEVVEEWVTFLFDNLELDDGVYYSASDPACTNYAGSNGTSSDICPL